MAQAQELINEIQKGLLQWYDFKEDRQALYVGDKSEPLAQMLFEKKLHVVCASLESVRGEDWQQEYDGYFDYIVCIEILEKQTEPEIFLKLFRKLLTDEGILLLGMNNRMGIRYFCGDRDIHTDRCFDGVEGYKRAYTKKEDEFKGRSYSMTEIKTLLKDAGWKQFHFYSVFSDLINPTLLYAEGFLPNEDLSNRLIPFFHHSQTVFMDERMLYKDLIDNGMFHQMANAYLVECTQRGDLSDINHVTCSMDRGRERALFTIIHRSGTVEKRAAYPEGRKRLEQFIEHGRDLTAHGIRVVDAKLEKGAYVMPYVKGESAQLYLKRLIETDKDKFLKEMDRFRDLILQSSETAKEDIGDGGGAVLSRGYLDMVPLNCFCIDGEFVFYDQEFCKENYPANAIITRMITTFYCGNTALNKIVPMHEMFARYNLADRAEHWQQMESAFLTDILNARELSPYYGRHRIDEGSVNSNRQRINCSDAEYREIFIDIFKDTDTRKLILFGSGNFAKKFLELYQKDYPVSAIIDNNKERWKDRLCGEEICSPDMLKQLKSDEYKVIICIKNYVSVINQLQDLGTVKYSIYDANIGYGRKRPGYTVQKTEKTEPKKYHVGYISGVFDLFHIGHLNMFRRAKEQCDYLIVGVVTDEGVRKLKKVEPFVPFAERIEMVRSCRYVDEAVEIPLQYHDTTEAYKLYQFDCQFSGSDYSNDPSWERNKAFLEQNGSAMVFFPYTESTSSSKIKALIERRLM